MDEFDRIEANIKAEQQQGLDNCPCALHAGDPAHPTEEPDIDHIVGWADVSALGTVLIIAGLVGFVYGIVFGGFGS